MLIFFSGSSYDRLFFISSVVTVSVNIFPFFKQSPMYTIQMVVTIHVMRLEGVPYA